MTASRNLGLLACALIASWSLAACSNPTAARSTSTTASDGNGLACTSVYAVIAGVKPGATVPPLPSTLFGYAKRATNPELHRLAETLASAHSASAVRTDIVKFVTQCHALGIGPGVKGFA